MLHSPAAHPAATPQSAPPRGTALYATIWRWHFYAGLFVLPFILILSVTGAIYLFRPQIERWEERSYLALDTGGAVSPDRQLAAALAADPGARFSQYRLPRAEGDAAVIQLGLADGRSREVFVSPQARVLGSLDPARRIAAVVARTHGTLLIGRWGDWLVELAASWTIVMILTGLYLWWPRPLRLAGTLWPRLGLRGRPLLKDVHRVLGFWIAGLMLVMLASGLPWAGAWGSAFTWARTELGLIKEPPAWKIGVDDGHAGHGHDGMAGTATTTEGTSARSARSLPLAAFVARAEAEHMAFPVVVLPPQAARFGGVPREQMWTVKSLAQNRTLTRQVFYDPATGREIGRRGFADQPVIDRIVGTGVAWHEGQLFGLANQIVGLLTAVALVGVSILGVLMWLRRRPQGRVGAPPPVARSRVGWIVAAMVLLGLLLPLLGASVLAMLLADRARRLVVRPARRAAG